MIIVDGYNAIYKWKSLRKLLYNMVIARGRFVNILSNYQGYIGEDIVIVFDSSLKEKRQDSSESPQNIKVVYAPNNQGADIYIDHMVGSSKNPSGITVVTGDFLERSSVIRHGANTISPEKFEEEVKKVCESRSGITSE